MLRKIKFNSVKVKFFLILILNLFFLKIPQNASIIFSIACACYETDTSNKIVFFFSKFTSILYFKTKIKKALQY